MPNREIGQECLNVVQGSNALSSRIFVGIKHPKFVQGSNTLSSRIFVGIKHPKLAFLLSRGALRRDVTAACERGSGMMQHYKQLKIIFSISICWHKCK